MPYIMGLEGPRAPRPSLFGLAAGREDPGNCCWHCPCPSNICCDPQSASSRAYAAVRRVAARAGGARALSGVFTPVTSRPLLAVGALLFGAWLAGSKSGQKLVARVRRR